MATTSAPSSAFAGVTMPRGAMRAAPNMPMRIMGRQSRMTAGAAAHCRCGREMGANVTRVVLIGATGRMGTAIVRETVRQNGRDKAGDTSMVIVGAVASPGSQSTGLDIGEVAGGGPLGVPVTAELRADLGKADVAIDFSRPDLSLRALNVCRAARVPIVIGTTGHGAEFEARVAG